MGRSAAAALPGTAATFELADDVLGYGLARLCFEGPLETLTRTDRAQTAIFVTSTAVVRGLEAADRLDRATIGAAAGLSLGEYTALWFAGALSFEDGLRLVDLRGRAMQEASEARPSGMVSLIGADRERAEEVCREAGDGDVLVVANLNAPGQVVVSGDVAACERVLADPRRFGVRRAVRLNVAGAFHSPVMEPARERLAAAVEDTPVEDPAIPVYGNVTAAPVTAAAEVRALLARQVVEPVLFEDSVRRMRADGVEGFLEPAPGRVLAGLVRKIDADAPVHALDEHWEPDGS